MIGFVIWTLLRHVLAVVLYFWCRQFISASLITSSLLEGFQQDRAAYSSACPSPPF